MTTTTTETIKNVKTLDEAKALIDDAFNKLGLKSVSVFVWSDTTAGIEVKISIEYNEPDEPKQT